jgi:Flp pilus assembly protein TadG
MARRNPDPSSPSERGGRLRARILDFPLSGLTSRARGARRGNYSLIMGFTLFSVVGFGALSVDVSLITMSKLQAQATADAASHAALVAFHKNMSTVEGTVAAAYIANRNKVGMGIATLRPGDPTFGQWDFDLGTFSPGLDANGNANAVRVSVDRTGANAVDLMLAPILGVPKFDVSATSITAQQMRGIMLIQDMSGSMMYSPGTAIQASRQANLAFYTYLKTRPQPGDMLGLAMFAASGTFPASHGEYWATNDPTETPWIPLSLIQGNDPLFTAGMNGICNTLYATACGGGTDPHPRNYDIGECTNPSIALRQATNELIEKTDSTFFRGIVFMSDGMPTCGPFDAVAAADTAWNNDIHIWTVVFHNGSFDPAFMSSLTRGIGFSQVSPNAADLPEMYRQIARALPTAFVN